LVPSRENKRELQQKRPHWVRTKTGGQDTGKKKEKKKKKKAPKRRRSPPDNSRLVTNKKRRKKEKRPGACFAWRNFQTTGEKNMGPERGKGKRGTTKDECVTTTLFVTNVKT